MTFKVGDTVTVNEPGHARHREKGVITYTYTNTAIVSFSDNQKELFAKEHLTFGKYSFDTYIRAFDNVECETVTGIPAETFKNINIPERIRDSL